MFVFSVLIIGYRHRHAMLPIELDEITQSWCQLNAESVRPSNAEAQFNWFNFNLQIYEIIMKLRSIFPINFPINFFYYYLPTNLTNLTNLFVIICVICGSFFLLSCLHVFYYYLPQIPRIKQIYSWLFVSFVGGFSCHPVFMSLILFVGEKNTFAHIKKIL